MKWSDTCYKLAAKDQSRPYNVYLPAEEWVPFVPNNLHIKWADTCYKLATRNQSRAYNVYLSTYWYKSELRLFQIISQESEET